MVNLIEKGTKIIGVGRNYVDSNPAPMPKAIGLPWLLAKGLDTFTPISEMISKDAVPDPLNLELWLKVGQSHQFCIHPRSYWACETRLKDNCRYNRSHRRSFRCRKMDQLAINL
ncbi:putative acylpyruvase FAHD1 mitochondrial [Bienertia sinuspersici]